MYRILFSLLAVIFSISVRGQMMDPVHFTSQLKMLDNGEAEIIFNATVDPGWHVYSTDLGNDGPVSATFNAVKMDGVETVGKLKPRGNVTKQFDKMFDMELRFFEHKATFVQKIRFTKPQYTIDCYLEYGACNDEMCMPPSQVELKKSGRIELTDRNFGMIFALMHHSSHKVVDAQLSTIDVAFDMQYIADGVRIDYKGS